MEAGPLKTPMGRLALDGAGDEITGKQVSGARKDNLELEAGGAAPSTRVLRHLVPYHLGSGCPAHSCSLFAGGLTYRT